MCSFVVMSRLSLTKNIIVVIILLPDCVLQIKRVGLSLSLFAGATATYYY